jgi:hypothetical protein
MRPRAGTRFVCALLQQLVLLAGIVCVLSIGRLHAQSIQYVYDDLGRLIKVLTRIATWRSTSTTPWGTSWKLGVQQSPTWPFSALPPRRGQ